MTATPGGDLALDSESLALLAALALALDDRAGRLGLGVAIGVEKGTA